MSTSMIAMGIALFVVVNLVLGLGALSLLIGTFETLFGKPRLTILRSTKSGNFFSFGLKWDSVKQPAEVDTIRIRLYNPYGSPTQVEVSKNFDGFRESFANEVDMGPGYLELLGAKNFELAQVEVEAVSSRDGVSFKFVMKGSKFKKLISDANLTAEQFISDNKLGGSKASKPPIDIPIRNFVADTVPGKGAQLAIATNPAFESYFAGMGGGAAKGGAAAAEAPAAQNFNITKVWIEPGCIVCNACEDIYPEVFEVTSDTCLIRPDAPLDNGLRVQEAAEACPVEVIKFTKAS